MNAADKQDRVRMEAAMLQIHASCFDMCVTDFRSKELSEVEVRCVERCGWKYLTAHNHFAMANAKAQRGPAKGGIIQPQPQMTKL